MDEAQSDRLEGDILVADDMLPNLLVLSTMLTEQGYKVRGAPNGSTALMIAQAKPPDLILLDVKMPGMDGYDVCRRLKEHPETRAIPVIFISALGEVIDKVKGFEAGGVDYITKPFHVEEVLARVRTHLTLRRLQAQLEATNIQLRREIAERVQAEAELKRYRDHLEELVKERTAELEKEIAEHMQTEEQLGIRLGEREVLMAEIHDRIKNNMQIIVSMLNLQARHIQDEQARAVFRESQRRIRAMALVHERFYQSKNAAKIDFAGYIQQTARNLFQQHGVDPGAIVLKVDAQDVWLGLGTAVPCGLMINELVSNCMRHAFPGGKTGEITVELVRLEADDARNAPRKDRFILTVRDNGVGLPQDLDVQHAGSLGLQLVTSLAGQLNGAVELDRGGGTTFKITFEEQR